jgi:hypothetical protein
MLGAERSRTGPSPASTATSKVEQGAVPVGGTEGADRLRRHRVRRAVSAHGGSAPICLDGRGPRRGGERYRIGTADDDLRTLRTVGGPRRSVAWARGRQERGNAMSGRTRLSLVHTRRGDDLESDAGPPRDPDLATNGRLSQLRIEDGGCLGR